MDRVDINGEPVSKAWISSLLELKPYDSKTNEELKNIYFTVKQENRHVPYYVQVIDGIPVKLFEHNEIYWKSIGNLLDTT
jgi:hypothetical protein